MQDGLSDINIKNLIDFHKQNSVLATLSAVSPPGRFGALDIDDGLVSSFVEKPMGDNARINGGFFILSPKVIDYIKNDQTIWEREPLEKLSSEGQLAAYKHDSFWHPMDTLRDKIYLEDLWNAKKAQWKTWVGIGAAIGIVTKLFKQFDAISGSVGKQFGAIGMNSDKFRSDIEQTVPDMIRLGLRAEDLTAKEMQP